MKDIMEQLKKYHKEQQKQKEADKEKTEELLEEHMPEENVFPGFVTDLIKKDLATKTSQLALVTYALTESLMPVLYNPVEWNEEEELEGCTTERAAPLVLEVNHINSILTCIYRQLITVKDDLRVLPWEEQEADDVVRDILPEQTLVDSLWYTGVLVKWIDTVIEDIAVAVKPIMWPDFPGLFVGTEEETENNKKGKEYETVHEYLPKITEDMDTCMKKIKSLTGCVLLQEDD